MKAKIKVKMLAEIEPPKEFVNGEFIDLRAGADTWVGIKPITMIPLGVAMQLPKGYEAIIVPRSSTAKNFNIWMVNSVGIVDNSYNGNGDEWRFPAATIGEDRVLIHQGDRICQFRIQLSQKATMWQRIKWLFTSGIEIEIVPFLNNENRGGIGSTGKN